MSEFLGYRNVLSMSSVPGMTQYNTCTRIFLGPVVEPMMLEMHLLGRSPAVGRVPMDLTMTLQDSGSNWQIQSVHNAVMNSPQNY